jgi:hypothetical protein
MKRPASPISPQLNLPLIDILPATLPDTSQRELALALMELLISAAQWIVDNPAGGNHERETDR